MLLLILVRTMSWVQEEQSLKLGSTIEPFLMKSTECCLRADARRNYSINLIF
jgi:hypothetical protein